MRRLLGIGTLLDPRCRLKVAANWFLGSLGYILDDYAGWAYNSDYGNEGRYAPPFGGIPG